MSAEILTFPAPTPRVRLVVSNEPQSEADRADEQAYLARLLLDASWIIAGAQAELTDGQMRIDEGGQIKDDHAVMNGETLESVLETALCLINLNGASNRDREISHAIRNWILSNGSANDA